MGDDSRGRPTAYSGPIASEVCERLAKGESLNAICQSEGMPYDAGITLDRGDDFVRVRTSNEADYIIAH